MRAPIFPTTPNPINPDLVVGPDCPDCGRPTGACLTVHSGHRDGGLPICDYCGCVPAVSPDDVLAVARWADRDWRANEAAVAAGLISEGQWRAPVLPAATAANAEVRNLKIQGINVVRDGRVLAVTREAGERRAEKAKAAARHADYLRRLETARAAMDADPALKQAAVRLYAYKAYLGHGVTHICGRDGWVYDLPGGVKGEPGRYRLRLQGWPQARRAALALAYAGFPWKHGMYGGTIGGVSLRGALRLGV